MRYKGGLPTKERYRLAAAAAREKHKNIRLRRRGYEAPIPVHIVKHTFQCTCKICGGVFVGHHPNAAICSPQCKKANDLADQQRLYYEQYAINPHNGIHEKNPLPPSIAKWMVRIKRIEYRRKQMLLERAGYDMECPCLVADAILENAQ